MQACVQAGRVFWSGDARAHACAWVSGLVTYRRRHRHALKLLFRTVQAGAHAYVGGGHALL